MAVLFKKRERPALSVLQLASLWVLSTASVSLEKNMEMMMLPFSLPGLVRFCAHANMPLRNACSAVRARSEPVGGLARFDLQGPFVRRSLLWRREIEGERPSFLLSEWVYFSPCEYGEYGADFIECACVQFQSGHQSCRFGILEIAFSRHTYTKLELSSQAGDE